MPTVLIFCPQAPKVVEAPQSVQAVNTQPAPAPAEVVGLLKVRGKFDFKSVS